MKIKHDSQGPRTVHECEDCKSKHTPTPWRIENIDADDYIAGSDDRWIVSLMGSPDEEDKANAAYIVKAVNCHEELVNMLKKVHREGAGVHYEAISELIAKAETK